MSGKPDPTRQWMWAQACDLMEQAERMQRQFFRLASPGERAQWEPPVDVYEDEREIVVLVAMPGVPDESVRVTIEEGTILVRGERPFPFGRSGPTVRHLEIPYGYFERRLRLPQVPLEGVTRELSHGCLILRLRKAG